MQLIDELKVVFIATITGVTIAMIPDKGSIRRFARATGHNIISLFL